MNEITNCRPATASMHDCRNGWFLLKRIETTFVSRRRTFISGRAGGWTQVTKLSNHLVESIDFGGIAVVNRGEFADRGLQSRNTDLRIGQFTRIDDLRHDSSVSDSAPPSATAGHPGRRASATCRRTQERRIRSIQNNAACDPTTYRASTTPSRWRHTPGRRGPSNTDWNYRTSEAKNPERPGTAPPLPWPPRLTLRKLSPK